MAAVPHTVVCRAAFSAASTAAHAALPVIFCNSVYAVRRARFDPLPALLDPLRGSVRARIAAALTASSATLGYGAGAHDVLSIDPRPKDGGAFVALGPRETGPEKDAVGSVAAVPSNKNQWSRLLELCGLVPRPQSFRVVGQVFNEDIASLLPSVRLRIDVLGDPAPIETLFNIYRIYGPITDIQFLSPTVALVTFKQIRSATSARNCTYNYHLGGTTLRPSYEPLLKTRAILDWLVSHPRLVLPTALALFLGIAVAVFDPLHVFLMDLYYSRALPNWTRLFALLDPRLTSLFELLSKSAPLPPSASPHPVARASGTLIGQQRPYLSEETAWLEKISCAPPEAISLITGAANTGKTSVALECAKNVKVALVIDFDVIVRRSNSMSEVAGRLARQLGFMPYFPSLNRLWGQLDGLLSAAAGTKTGFSASAESDIAHMINCAGVALASIAHRRKEGEKYPLVIIDNFMLERDDLAMQQVYENVARWAGWLVENKVANVIVVANSKRRGSGQPSASQALEASLPSKPLRVFQLTDMPEAAARAMVAQTGSGTGRTLNAEEQARAFSTLGGRASDIEAFCGKLQRGVEFGSALDEMEQGAIQELHKHGFSKYPEHLWNLLRQLTETNSYARVKASPLFAVTDERDVLAELERAEIIAVGYRFGVPVSLRMHRPLFAAAARRLIGDAEFAVAMDVATWRHQIALDTAKLRSLQNEYAALKGTSATRGHAAVERRLETLAAAIGRANQSVDDVTRKLGDALKQKRS